MKKMIIGAILLAGLPVLAKEQEKQTITFTNKDTDDVRLFIKNKDDGQLRAEKRLRPNESFDLTYEEGTHFAVQAHEEGGKQLDTGLNYLYLRPKHKKAEVEIIKMIPTFRTSEKLIFSSKNAKLRNPWFKPTWQADKK
jgi:hypothetical protein